MWKNIGPKRLCHGRPTALPTNGPGNAVATNHAADHLTALAFEDWSPWNKRELF